MPATLITWWGTSSNAAAKLQLFFDISSISQKKVVILHRNYTMIYARY